MKTLLILPILCLASCGIKINPIKLTYEDPKTGLRISENVGDGVFGLEVDLTKPIDLGGGRTLDVQIEPAK
jgi:hypothetical protein